jgi:dTDP-4-amino-4,6-dideoxygalactose transaminase
VRERLAIEGGPQVRKEPYPPWPQPTEEDVAAVAAVVRSGGWCSAGQGQATVRAFEEAFADACRPADDAAPRLDCVAVASGTAALIIALAAVGVQPGDEVIVPPYTFIATASAAVFLGAVPVFADVEPGTLCLDPEAVARAWSPRTRAVVPVHFAGCPADMDALTALCRARGAALVEDACQAPGAAWNGRPVGSWGDLGCFSFQESKNLSAGEGGAITGRGEVLDIAWSLHNVGRTRDGAWYAHARIGQNARLTALQAALLRSQMRRWPEQARRRAEAAAQLRAALAEVPGIRPPAVPERVTAHAWHLFPFGYEPEAFGGRSRDAFVAALRAEGIPASTGYSLLSDNVALQEAAAANAARAGAPLPPRGAAHLPVAAAAARDGCWLFHTALLAGEQGVADVVRAIQKVRAAWGGG